MLVSKIVNKKALFWFIPLVIVRFDDKKVTIKENIVKILHFTKRNN